MLCLHTHQVVHWLMEELRNSAQIIWCVVGYPCLPCSLFFSSWACSWLGKEWKLRGLLPNLSGGNVSLSNWSLILWYSLRLAGTENTHRQNTQQMIFNDATHALKQHQLHPILHKWKYPYQWLHLPRTDVCVCVCVYVCMWWLHSGNFPSDFPSASHQPHQSTQLWLGTWHLLGYKSKAFSHDTAMVQVGLRVPTPLAARKGLFSCEFLARLQELCLYGSQCLLSAQTSWLCQVHVIT